MIVTSSPYTDAIIKIGRIIQSRCFTQQHSLESAISRANEALRVGRISDSLKIFEYAQRQAPSDSAITYAIGVLRICLNDPRATEPLELIAKRTNNREVMLDLARARLNFGDVEGALLDLHRLLQTNSYGVYPDFIRCAEIICNLTKTPGWCGLNNRGHLILGGSITTKIRGKVALQIDRRSSRIYQVEPHDKSIRLSSIDGRWFNAKTISVSIDGHRLIGSPLDVQKIVRLEGFVSCSEDGIEGWCWLPSEPEFIPIVEVFGLVNPRKVVRRAARRPHQGIDHFREFAMPRSFSLSLAELGDLEGPLTVRSTHGRRLLGTPIDPWATLRSKRSAVIGISKIFPLDKASLQQPIDIIREPCVPIGPIPSRQMISASILPRPVSIVIPVYRGLKTTLSCIESVISGRSLPEENIIVVADASPDPDLVKALNRLAKDGQIFLKTEKINKGFPASVNTGIRAAFGQDVIVLNSDTLVPPGWAATLQSSVYKESNIGTASPLSNDATIFSYPKSDVRNPMLSLDDICAVSLIASNVNKEEVVDVPTTHGFCMYIRSSCLKEVGLFREDVFGQGYGEENDFCMRARALGWRHVAVPGVLVGHVGSQSFADAKAHLIRRNLGILNRLHPGYDKLIQDWLNQDPLGISRRRLDIGRLRLALANRSVIALITHDREGGVKRQVRERALIHAETGMRVVILRPFTDRSGGRSCVIDVWGDQSFVNLVFFMPREEGDLRELLKEIGLTEVEFHHFIGHHPSIFDLVTKLGVPYTVYLHDYSWFCPRITLTNGWNRYCGEPNLAGCNECVSDHGSNIEESISPERLRSRSREFFSGASQLIAPSFDTARRFHRQLNVESKPTPWEPRIPLRLKLASERIRKIRRICIVGAISYEKGFDIVLGIARIVQRELLPIKLVIVGFTCDDERLLDTGFVEITGRYSEQEVTRLIRAQVPDFGFLPSIWPETWSYTLSQMWNANLPVVAFDIGAPAERIRATGGGLVVPVNISLEKLVTIFLNKRILGRI